MFYKSDLSQIQTSPLPGSVKCSDVSGLLSRGLEKDKETALYGGPWQKRQATHLYLRVTPGDLEQAAQPHPHQDICSLAQEICWNDYPITLTT